MILLNIVINFFFFLLVKKAIILYADYMPGFKDCKGLYAKIQKLQKIISKDSKIVKDYMQILYREHCISHICAYFLFKKIK